MKTHYFSNIEELEGCLINKIDIESDRITILADNGKMFHIEAEMDDWNGYIRDSCDDDEVVGEDLVFFGIMTKEEYDRETERQYQESLERHKDQEEVSMRRLCDKLGYDLVKKNCNNGKEAI